MLFFQITTEFFHEPKVCNRICCTNTSFLRNSFKYCRRNGPLKSSPKLLLSLPSVASNSEFFYSYFYYKIYCRESQVRNMC